MLMMTKEVELTKEEFGLFRDFIHEKSGIFFANNKMYLIKNRLNKRINDLGINSFKDYFYRVKYDVTMKEFNNLMNLVTTNETSFYRNPPQLNSFANEVLPLLTKQKLSAKGPKSIKIWSAGCSTGEEPYTLAMLIMEHLKSTLGWNIEILASDISEQVLKRAREGVYGEMTMRSTPREIVQKYFIKEKDQFRVKPEIKRLVRFGHLNLNDGRKLSMYSDMDFIFCRNVMIYFSNEVKKQLVRGFYNALLPGGYFYIGHSESLHGLSKAFKLVYFKSALVYHKETTKISEGLEFPEKTSSERQGVSRATELLQKIKPVTVK
jgi:chemotaxis protein methyltransferase CheR